MGVSSPALDTNLSQGRCLSHIGTEGDRVQWLKFILKLLIPFLHFGQDHLEESIEKIQIKNAPDKVQNQFIEAWKDFNLESWHAILGSVKSLSAFMKRFELPEFKSGRISGILTGLFPEDCAYVDSRLLNLLEKYTQSELNHAETILKLKMIKADSGLEGKSLAKMGWLLSGFHRQPVELLDPQVRKRLIQLSHSGPWFLKILLPRFRDASESEFQSQNCQKVLQYLIQYLSLVVAAEIRDMGKQPAALQTKSGARSIGQWIGYLRENMGLLCEVEHVNPWQEAIIQAWKHTAPFLDQLNQLRRSFKNQSPESHEFGQILALFKSLLIQCKAWHFLLQCHLVPGEGMHLLLQRPDQSMLNLYPGYIQIQGEIFHLKEMKQKRGIYINSQGKLLIHEVVLSTDEGHRSPNDIHP